MFSRYKLDLSYLYHGLRLILLAFVIFFSIVWLAFGFDSSLPGLIDPANQGTGIHWSSIQTFFITTYVIIINFNVDGIKSFRHLYQEIKLDFKYFKNRKEIENIIISRKPKVNALTALVYGFLVGVLSFAVFEIPYIYLLNFFHFGSINFPTYMYKTEYLGFAFYRNYLCLLLPLYLIWFLTKFKLDNGKFKYSPKTFKFRFNVNALVLICVTILVFFTWIVTPSTLEPETPETLGLTPANYTFPKQDLFPQTVYTYLTVPVDTYHNDSHLNGWHQEDTPTHIINTIAKYMVFFTVTYICMAKFVFIEVKENAN